MLSPGRFRDDAFRATRGLSTEAQSREHARAVRGWRTGERAAVRRPAARSPEAPLRPPARARRRARELGCSEGDAHDRLRATPRSARRGPPARVRRLRGRDTGRSIRRRDGRDLGSGNLRARRGEEGRGAHRASARRASRRRLDARPGPARRRRPQLASPAEGRRASSAVVRADAGRGDRDASAGGGVGVRAEVGRFPRYRRRRGWGGDAAEPQRQRPHRALRARREGSCARGPVSRCGDRRRGLRARRLGHVRLRIAAAGRRHARVCRVRRARAGRRACCRPTLRRAAGDSREPCRREHSRGARLPVVRRRRRPRSRGEGARARGGRCEEARVSLPTGPSLARLAKAEAEAQAGARDSRLHAREGSAQQRDRLPRPRRPRARVGSSTRATSVPG